MPFPSSPGPLYQNEVKCSAFDMETIFILKQIKLIFTRKVAHLASFWKWGFLELGSGLLIWKEFSYTKRANAKKVVHKRPLVVKFARLTLTCIRAIVWFGFHCKFPRSFCPFWVYAWDWVGVVSNCTMGLFSGHGFWPIFSRYIVMANKTSGCFTKQSSRHTTAQHRDHATQGAFHSIQNSGHFGWYIKWNGPFRFGPTEIFGTSFEGGPLWPVWSFQSVRPKCPFPFDKIVVPRQYRSFVSCFQEQ